MRFWIALLLPLAWTGAAPANELSNGDFATDTFPWGTFDPVGVLWNSLDVDASPSSGSLRLEVSPPSPSPDNLGADSECIELTAGETYELSAWVYIPSTGQGSAPAARIGLMLFDAPGCMFSDLDHVVDTSKVETFDTWTELQLQHVAAAPLTHARAFLIGHKFFSGPTTVYHFDAIALPEPAGWPVRLTSAAALAWLVRRRRRSSRPDRERV
jgi:hypothetical protein